MLDRRTLLADLQKLQKSLAADLRERSSSPELPEIARQLREEHQRAAAAARTGGSYGDWLEDRLTQQAAAWVLSSVFVRFLEDNQLVDPPRIAGPGQRLQRARDEHEHYFAQHPQQTDREYLLDTFDRLAQLPGGAEIFGPHNPLRELPQWLSGDAAGELLRFFQQIDPASGALRHDFTDPGWDTRFLGDLYQDLSEEARKRYALLQTPEFVEEFILDRTLDPAVEEFGLEGLRLIDPACGSGHFLLGAFRRLLDRWQRREPGANVRVLAQRALDSVHGVDLNPYAVAIARFRLLVAALQASGLRRLADAPAFKLHLACGDSLLHGEGHQLTLVDSEGGLTHVYQSEDSAALRKILKRGHYHAVVANPPYITPKDKALNQAYRDRYTTCHMKYSLGVPFLERIFQLAVAGGYTGQITANSFMKREFGKRLIEQFFPTVDLTHVIDTSGAYIPGHGTPTVILFGRQRRPLAETIRTVMGIRGEPSTPDEPAQGLVWSAIVRQVDQAGSQSEFVSVNDSPREAFHKHPWSIGGGGAAELKEQLDEIGSQKLGDIIDSIGFMSITGEDEAFVGPVQFWDRVSAPHRGFGVGDAVRDWATSSDEAVCFMYAVGETIEVQPLASCGGLGRLFWNYRTTLRNRLMFGKLPEESGLAWYEYRFKSDERLRTPLSIVFAFVATHNHFVLDRGGKVFNRSAPVIKLPPEASEDDHLALLGLLNSSTACFWMKQVTQIKTQTTGMDSADWQLRREFDCTKLRQFPSMPAERLLDISRRIDANAERLAMHSAAAIVRNFVRCPAIHRDLRSELSAAREVSEFLLAQMLLLQEELDWAAYGLYGLVKDVPQIGCQLDVDVPTVRKLRTMGTRPFEIALARRVASGNAQTDWFRRHQRIPLTTAPDDLPHALRDVIARRLAVIDTNPDIALIEQPDYKRRWIPDSWEAQQELSLRDWLLARLESYFDFDGRMNDERRSTAQLDVAVTSTAALADVAARDAEFLAVGEVYRDDPAFDVPKLVAELVEAESVPLLPVLRYKESGLRKRAEWERTWDLQRQEDAGRSVGAIPVPPKYASADFAKGDYWRLRGKLDVPKERWISLPHAPGADGTLALLWAGYDHLQQARALAAHYVDIQENQGGRDDPRLPPLLACLAELLPWLRQWHNDLDPQYQQRMGDYFTGFVEAEAKGLGKTLEEIRAWTPPKKARGRGRKAAQTEGE